MKRKIFEFRDDVVAQFEAFCAQRGLVEKRVVESMVIYFMAQDADTREMILMAGSDSEDKNDKASLAAKRAQGIHYTRKRKPKA